MSAFEEVKRRIGAAELHALFDAAGLVLRGSGRNRARCPRCQDSPRDVSIGERGGIGVWRCHHCGAGGSAIDLLSLSRGISGREAVAELERVASVLAGATRSVALRTSVSGHPPASEVFALWSRCLPVCSDPKVAGARSEPGIGDVGVHLAERAPDFRGSGDSIDPGAKVRNTTIPFARRRRAGPKGA